MQKESGRGVEESTLKDVNGNVDRVEPFFFFSFALHFKQLGMSLVTTIHIM